MTQENQGHSQMHSIVTETVFAVHCCSFGDGADVMKFYVSRFKLSFTVRDSVHKSCWLWATSVSQNTYWLKGMSTVVHWGVKITQALQAMTFHVICHCCKSRLDVQRCLCRCHWGDLSVVPVLVGNADVAGRYWEHNLVFDELQWNAHDDGHVRQVLHGDALLEADG